jgi:hypothetical protein
VTEKSPGRGHIKFTQHCSGRIVDYTETMLVDHIIAAHSRRLEFIPVYGFIGCRFDVMAGPGDMS